MIWLGVALKRLMLSDQHISGDISHRFMEFMKGIACFSKYTIITNSSVTLLPSPSLTPRILYPYSCLSWFYKV